MTLRECYKLLNVPNGASEDVVKQAYRKRAFELHPDLHPDDPNASRNFQQLNEAYVIITSASKSTESSSSSSYSGKARSAASGYRSERESRDSTVRDRARAAYRKAKSNFDAQKSRHASSGDTYNKQRPEFDDSFWNQEQRSYSKESVLNEILNDPFAKRVFEDIYREIKRDGGKTITMPKKRKLSMQWGERDISVDMTGGVKGWLQRQLDDNQEMHLPMHNLRPGAKVLLTLSQGLSGGTRKLEITLPQDFRVGHPIRLRRLGRKIGGWVGDLYLTIYGRM
ncbi:J domain-containing protein [Halodesulfovibrio marinisediminis]|uniref:Molecular chaperone DnaJ n=1 Tax=Halodesulfovibrio marinisediminis DSM 17456 TaxID=1121457 RepID=A0A1N6DHV8_9BACT|nr:J domain-containing protein [Halodesulfovibrio marinisediminis]SIN70264.1 molecular chaperone DnaJ [Halodesulfovibrio marinisediminis DSM 17456]